MGDSGDWSPDFRRSAGAEDDAVSDVIVVGAACAEGNPFAEVSGLKLMAGDVDGAFCALEFEVVHRQKLTRQIRICNFKHLIVFLLIVGEKIRRLPGHEIMSGRNRGNRH
jgi:hypothetical protein